MVKETQETQEFDPVKYQIGTQNTAFRIEILKLAVEVFNKQVTDRSIGDIYAELIETMQK